MSQQYSRLRARATHLLQQNSFIRHNAVYFIGSMGVSVFNYAYYPAISRFLSVSQFGEVQFLLATLLQATTVLTSFGLVVLFFTSNREENPEFTTAIQALETAFIYILGLLGVGVLIAAPWLQSFFQLQDAETIPTFVALLLLSVPMIFRNSILQALHQFWKAAKVGMLASFSKLIISLALLALGYTALGIFGGLIVAHVLAALYAYALTSKLVPFLPVVRWSHFKLLANHASLLAFVVSLTALSAVLYGIDILAVKHYFPPDEAGGYAGVATAGRIVFFLTTSVATVLVSSVKPTHSDVQNRNILLRSLFLGLLIGGAGSLVLCISPTWTLNILVGEQYLGYAYLLAPMCLAVLQMTLINVWLYYYVALREYLSLVFLVIGLALVGGLMVVRHSTLMDIILNLIIGGVIILIMLAAYELVKLGLSRHGKK